MNSIHKHKLEYHKRFARITVIFTKISMQNGWGFFILSSVGGGADSIR